MAEQAINPLVPNLGPQSEAMSGVQGMVFTATDRQLIKELAGEVDTTRSFKEVFFNDEMNAKVENEQTSVNPGQDTKVVESRQREHKQMLKNAALIFHRERVNLSDAAKAEVATAPNVSVGQPTAPAPTPEPQPPTQKPAISQETAAIVKELNLDPDELYDKFTLDQNDLHALVHRIREHHLKRLLCSTKEEFDKLTLAISEETIRSGRPEAKEWLENELKNLTKSAAEYKLNLLKSMQSLHYDDERDKSSAWLLQVIAGQ